MIAIDDLRSVEQSTISNPSIVNRQSAIRRSAMANRQSAVAAAA
jgi:hypothetical protein